MSYLLRKIRKSRWYSEKPLEWLEAGELQADALSDLATSNNELSFWRVSDNREDIEIVIAALASNCDHVSNVDYLLISETEIAKLNILFQDSPGNSPHPMANERHHCDAKQLNADRLHKLGLAILQNGTRERLSSRKIRPLLLSAMETGNLNINRMKNSLLGSLREN